MSAAIYITAQAHIDTADQVASEMERKWGCGRLRLLVSAELTEKFDRQRYLWNQAIWYGDLEAVRREAARMITAWRTLDRVAAAAGQTPLAPQVWEVRLKDGTVAAIVPDFFEAHAVVAQGRAVVVYSLEEIGRLLEAYHVVIKAKQAFPGATVTEVRRPNGDPLNAIIDTKPGLDDLMDDPLPFFGGV